MKKTLLLRPTFYKGEKDTFLYTHLVGDTYAMLLAQDKELDFQTLSHIQECVRAITQICQEGRSPQEIREHIYKVIQNVPFISIAGGLVWQNTLSFFSFGKGLISFARGDKGKILIEGTNYASGYPNGQDKVVISAQIVLDHVPIEKIEEAIVNIACRSKGALSQESILVCTVDQSSRPDTKQTHFFTRRLLTISVLLILIGLLVWSVGFGVKRRKEARRKEQLTSSLTLIDEYLSRARENQHDGGAVVSSLEQAKTKLEEIKKIVTLQENDRIDKAKKDIERIEIELLKKDYKTGELFYDLSLIKKDARATSLSLDGDTAALLNPLEGEIYLVSLREKSKEVIIHKDIKDASGVGVYKNEVFFYKKREGIFKVDLKRNVSRIIEFDEAWGDIRDMWVYAGNIYLLDGVNQDVFKYTAVDEGYADKVSYFKTSPDADLSRSSSLAIDGSVYIGTDRLIYKYTSGLRDGFSFTLPTGNEYRLDRIFTSIKLDHVYLLDKDNVRIIILSKKGEYVKQIQSDIIQQAVGMVVNLIDEKETIFVLTEQALYTLSP